MEIKVEKNIPLPRTKGIWSKTVETMKPGDSIKVDTRNRCVAMTASGRSMGFTMAFRIEGDAFRVWRIK